MLQTLLQALAQAQGLWLEFAGSHGPQWAEVLLVVFPGSVVSVNDDINTGNAHSRQQKMASLHVPSFKSGKSIGL